MQLGTRFNGLQESIGEDITYEYTVFDVPETQVYADDAVLRQFVVDNVPPYENGIKLSGIKLKAQLNNTTWIVAAEYKTDNKSFPNQSSMTFDTTGQTVHKTIGIKRTFAESGVFDVSTGVGKSKDIGFNGEDVEGVDIGIGGMSFTETHPIPDATITDAYRKKLRDLSWTVNNAPFREYAAGEVLFKGCTGSKNGTEKWILTFNFESIKNQTNLQVFDVVIPLKKGWEYLWVNFMKQLSDDHKAIITTPQAVYVDQVYEETDFSELGIGITSWDELTQDHIGDREAILYPFGQ